MDKRLYIAIGLLSSSIIAFQLVLMQILSISQWSHFAYMVISVAMLGFGASGTLLSFTGKWLTRHIAVALPMLMLSTALSMAVIMYLSELVFAGFDSYLLFLDRSHILGLVTSYMILFIPFLLGAMAIGLVYMHHVSRIGSLYFADLFGSGLGGLIMVFMFWQFKPALLPFVIAMLPLTAGLLLFQRKYMFGLGSATTIVLFCILYGLAYPPALPMSQYKSLSRSLLLPEAKIVETQISPYGEIKLFSSSSLRFAPGLSLNYTGDIPIRKALFNNGNWYGPLVDFNNPDSTHFLDYATQALPFVISQPQKVLILDAGTGLYAAHALSRGASSITAVEPNKAATDMLNRYVPIPKDRIRFINHHSRSYLMSDTSQYDLIILPVIESFGGSSGINALNEQYLFTTEAFGEIWNRLSANGMMAVTVWHDHPARNSLKMLATLVEMVAKYSQDDPELHLAAIRGWGTITFIATKENITEKNIAQIRAFCKTRNFDPLLLPVIRPDERSYFNQLQDNTFLELIDRVMTEEREAFYSAYDFQIRPASDDKPYFSQYLRLDRMGKMREIFGQGSVPFLEVGYLIVLVTFIQIALAALILIILPLLAIGFKGGSRWYTLIHFSGIGIGFMFVEIMFIQQFTLYFGHPIYAAAVVLSGMLIFSGAGALFTQKFVIGKACMAGLMVAIVILILFMAFFLTSHLNASISAPLFVKILLSILFIGPLSFLMGMPFPFGLRLLGKHNNHLIPWAWGINGCFSVVSTALATIIAVETGFRNVMFIAALAYLFTMVVNLRAKWN